VNGRAVIPAVCSTHGDGTIDVMIRGSKDGLITLGPHSEGGCAFTMQAAVLFDSVIPWWPRRWRLRSADRAPSALRCWWRGNRPRSRLGMGATAGTGGCGGSCIPAAAPRPPPGGGHNPGREEITDQAAD